MTLRYPVHVCTHLVNSFNGYKVSRGRQREWKQGLGADKINPRQTPQANSKRSRKQKQSHVQSPDPPRAHRQRERATATDVVVVVVSVEVWRGPWLNCLHIDKRNVKIETNIYAPIYCQHYLPAVSIAVAIYIAVHVKLRQYIPVRQYIP